MMTEKPHDVPKDDDTTSVHMTPNLHFGAVSMDCFGWVCDKCGHGQMTPPHTGDICPGCGRKILDDGEDGFCDREAMGDE